MVEQRQRRARGHDFSFIEAGQGEMVLFVHGSCLDHRYWQRWVQCLSTEYHALALSRRHHWPRAMTDPRVLYTAADQAADLIAFIEASGQKPIHIIGHSYGGYLAALIACERPGLLASMILIEPGGPVEGQDPGQSIQAAIDQAIRLLHAGQPENAASAFFAAIDAQYTWHKRLADFMQMTLDNIATMPAQFRHPRAALPAAQLAACEVPTLVLLGENAISPFPETAAQLTALIPGARCHVISGASHMVDLDNPTLFEHHIKSFLKQET